MIIGELDLDWAEQDPDYLVRVKAFLNSKVEPRPKSKTTDDAPPPQVGQPKELALD